MLVLSPSTAGARPGLTPPAVTGVAEFFKPLEANSSSCLVLPDLCRQRRLEVQDGMPGIPSGRVRGAGWDPRVPVKCQGWVRDVLSPCRMQSVPSLGTWGAW